MNGQAANAFGQGVIQGYSFMDKMATNKQDREAQQQKMSLEAKESEQLIKSSVANTAQTNINTELKQMQVNSIQAVQKDNAAKKIPHMLNGAMNGTVTDQDFRGFIKNNPSMQETLGIKNVETVGSIHSSDATDTNSALYKYLATQFPELTDPTQFQESSVMYDIPGTPYEQDMELGLDSEEQAAYDKHMIELAEAQAPILRMTDGLVVNIHGLSIATGGPKYLLSSEQKKTEEMIGGIYKNTQTVANKPNANQVLFKRAEDTVNKDDYKGKPEEYAKAVNQEYIHLKRSEQATQGGTTEMRNVSWHEARVSNPDSTPLQKKQSSEWLSKHSQTGTIINNQYAQQNTADTLDTIDANTVEWDITTAPTEADNNLESATKNDKALYTKELKDEVAVATKLKSRISAGEAIMNDLVDENGKMKFESGYLDRIFTWLDKTLPETISAMSPEQITAETGMSIEGAQRLKDMSGASATEDEFRRTVGYMFGDSTMSEEARVQTLKTYLDKQGADMTKHIESIRSQGLPRTSKHLYGSTAKPATTSSNEKQSNIAQTVARKDSTPLDTVLDGWE